MFTDLFTSFDLMEYVKWYLKNIVSYPLTVLTLLLIVHYMSGYKSKIRYYTSYVIFILYPATFGLIVFPFFILNVRSNQNCMYGANLCKPMSKILRIKWNLKNGHRLSMNAGGAVVVSNHQSIFDVLGMFDIWHIMVRCTAISRKKLFWIWPFGLLAWLAGVIFIDRSANESTRQKMNNAAERIRKLKAKLWIFPEGTRNKNPGKLLTFKKGAFRIAISCQLPIIPVVFSPYYFIDGKKKHFGEGEVTIEALEPISTKGLTLSDVDDLMERTYQIMQAKNEELRQKVFGKNEVKQMQE